MFAFKRHWTILLGIASLAGLLTLDGGAVRAQTWRQEGRLAARASRQAGRVNARTFGDFGNRGYMTYYAPGGYYAGPIFYRPYYAGGYYGGPGIYGAPLYGGFAGPRYYSSGPVYGPGVDAGAPVYGPSTTIRPTPRAYLGITMSETPEGVVRVSGVRPDSPAAQAGLLPGDALLAIDGREIFTTQDVTRMVARHVPGEAVRLDVDRDGQNDKIEAVLASPGAEPVTSGPLPTLAPANQNPEATGFGVQGSGPSPTLAPAENAAPYEALPAP